MKEYELFLSPDKLINYKRCVMVYLQVPAHGIPQECIFCTKRIVRSDKEEVISYLDSGLCRACFTLDCLIADGLVDKRTLKPIDTCISCFKPVDLSPQIHPELKRDRAQNLLTYKHYKLCSGCAFPRLRETYQKGLLREAND